MGSHAMVYLGGLSDDATIKIGKVKIVIGASGYLGGVGANTEVSITSKGAKFDFNRVHRVGGGFSLGLTWD